MKIVLEDHNPRWADQFKKLKAELSINIGIENLQIEHIGSTAVKGLSAKPIIDILVGLPATRLLDAVVSPMIEHGYIHYEIYNNLMPYRRFFVKHKSNIDHLNIPPIIKEEQDVPATTEEHNLRLAHIHILSYKSVHWVRHIAFRDYLQQHPAVRSKYQQLKEVLRTKEWRDGNEYNKAKDAFIKMEEKKAIDWYYDNINQ